MAPLAEQERINAVVRAAKDAVDSLRLQAEGARTRVDTLDQAILAKAFRGELVSQDPNDEPASVLLERIKAERRGST